MLLIVCRHIVIKQVGYIPMSKKPTKYRVIFANNLRKFRCEKNLSQEALAELTGLHRTYVGSVERAERNVSIDNMELFAKSLNTPLTELLK